MIDKEVNKKMIDALGIVDDKILGSPKSLTRKNILPPLNTQKSSPVPFAKERHRWEEPFGKDNVNSSTIFSQTCLNELRLKIWSSETWGPAFLVYLKLEKCA